jgi:hypothetical protein
MHTATLESLPYRRVRSERAATPIIVRKRGGIWFARFWRLNVSFSIARA